MKERAKEYFEKNGIEFDSEEVERDYCKLSADFAQSELRDQLIEYHKFLDHEEKDDMSEIENNVDIFLTK